MSFDLLYQAIKNKRFVVVLLIFRSFFKWFCLKVLWNMCCFAEVIKRQKYNFFFAKTKFFMIFLKFFCLTNLILQVKKNFFSSNSRFFSCIFQVFVYIFFLLFARFFHKARNFLINTNFTFSFFLQFFQAWKILNFFVVILIFKAWFLIALIFFTYFPISQSKYLQASFLLQTKVFQLQKAEFITSFLSLVSPITGDSIWVEKVEVDLFSIEEKDLSTPKFSLLWKEYLSPPPS